MRYCMEATTQGTDNTINRPGNTSGTTQVTNNITTQKPKDNKHNIKDKDKKPQATNTSSSIGSLRSSGTAKTGDTAPIVMVFEFMITALAAAFVLKNKLKEK